MLVAKYTGGGLLVERWEVPEQSSWAGACLHGGVVSPPLMQVVSTWGGPIKFQQRAHMHGIPHLAHIAHRPRPPPVSIIGPRRKLPRQNHWSLEPRKVGVLALPSPAALLPCPQKTDLNTRGGLLGL